jgi:hypothetical protein
MMSLAISKRMIKNIVVIFYYAASISRRRSCQSSLDRPRDDFVSVTFAMVATEFAEASQVVKIISGEIEPP